jgi:hypothetical protein
VRREKRGGRDVGRVLRKRVEPLIKGRQRIEKRGLLRQRKPDRLPGAAVTGQLPKATRNPPPVSRVRA